MTIDIDFEAGYAICEIFTYWNDGTLTIDNDEQYDNCTIFDVEKMYVQNNKLYIQNSGYHTNNIHVYNIDDLGYIKIKKGKNDATKI